LAKRSAKRQKLMTEERIPMIVSLINAGYTCEIGPILADYDIPNPDCTTQIQGMHERRKRSSGGSLTNPSNLVPACNSCNGFVEEFPEIVREETGDLLVLREGDWEWGAMSRRQDYTNGLDLVDELVEE